jgi:hypothetical protein
MFIGEQFRLDTFHDQHPTRHVGTNTTPYRVPPICRKRQISDNSMGQATSSTGTYT